MLVLLGVYYDNHVHTEEDSIFCLPYSRDAKSLMNQYGFFQLEEKILYGRDYPILVIKNFIPVNKDELTTVLQKQNILKEKDLEQNEEL